MSRKNKPLITQFDQGMLKERLSRRLTRMWTDVRASTKKGRLRLAEAPGRAWDQHSDVSAVRLGNLCSLAFDEHLVTGKTAPPPLPCPPKRPRRVRQSSTKFPPRSSLASSSTAR